MAAVSFGVPALTKLVENMDAHDRIIDERLTLEISEEGTGHNLLQPGYYVCFRDPRDSASEKFSLDNQLRVRDDKDQEFSGCSYAVLDIEPKFLASRERELDQKIAKLIAELNGKGQSGKSALEFLRDTMDGYDQYRRLQRGRELRAPAAQDA